MPLASASRQGASVFPVLRPFRSDSKTRPASRTRDPGRLVCLHWLLVQSGGVGRVPLHYPTANAPSWTPSFTLRWVGGVRHLAEIFTTYRESKEFDSKKLIARAEESATGSAFKRLGYLAERLWSGETAIIDLAYQNRTTGITRLGPAGTSRGKMSKRWGQRAQPHSLAALTRPRASYSPSDLGTHVPQPPPLLDGDAIGAGCEP